MVNIRTFVLNEFQDNSAISGISGLLQPLKTAIDVKKRSNNILNNVKNVKC